MGPPGSQQLQQQQQQQQRHVGQSPQLVRNSLVVSPLSRSQCTSTSTSRSSMTFTTLTTCTTLTRTKMQATCQSMLTILTMLQCLPHAHPLWRSASPPAPPSLPSSSAPTSSASTSAWRDAPRKSVLLVKNLPVSVID